MKKKNYIENITLISGFLFISLSGQGYRFFENPDFQMIFNFSCTIISIILFSYVCKCITRRIRNIKYSEKHKPIIIILITSAIIGISSGLILFYFTYN